MDTWKECAWFKCSKRFEPSRRSNQFQCADGLHHEGALYCSRSCQQKAYRLRRDTERATVTQNEAETVTKCPEGTTPHATVTRPKMNQSFQGVKRAKNGHARPDRIPRSKLIRNAQQAEFFGGGQWREVVSPDGVRCFVTRLWGKDRIAA